MVLARSARLCLTMFALALVASCGNQSITPEDDDIGGSGGGGSGGSGGRGGSGGGPQCGPVCDIYCQYGNVLDKDGCPTCGCNPGPQYCEPEECDASASTARLVAPGPGTGAAPEPDAPALPCPGPISRSCQRTGNNRCEWVTQCQPQQCDPVACDLACEFGFQTDPNGCATCRCNPAPTCRPADCGPQPRVTCGDGSLAPQRCQATRDGRCGWVTGMCGVCSAQECGPAPSVGACPPGQTRGEISCERTAQGVCGWVVDPCQPICPAIKCGTMCPFGVRKDANGCDTCECLPETCAPNECGMAFVAPPIACADGSSPAPMCRRNPTGQCSWRPGECPATPVCNTITNADRCGSIMGCRWLVPGCSQPAIPAAGCYDVRDLNCTSDAQCRNGKTCLKRVVNPCTGAMCSACAAGITMCL